MTDRIDFSRIIIDNKIIAALNFSRMIPVETNQLSRIDIKVRKHDNPQVVKRKQLYRQELQWCNENYDKIVNKANVLYSKYISGEYFKRKKDCLNFIELEEICKRYNSQS